MTLEVAQETSLNANPNPTDTGAAASDPAISTPTGAPEGQGGDNNAVQPGQAGEGQANAANDADPKPSRNQRHQEYINRLNREKFAALRRAEASDAAARALAKQLDDERKQRRASQDPAEVVGHVANDAIIAAESRAYQRTAQQAVQEARDLEARAWQAQSAEARLRYPDFDKVTHPDHNPGLAISETMGQTIRELPEGADLVYYLGKNPEKAEEIYALPARSQASALTRLITELPTAKAAVQAKTSGAPAPVQTLSGKAGNAQKPLSEMPMDEYVKARQAGRVS